MARPRQRVPRTSWRLCRNRRQSSNPWTGSHALTVTWRPSSDKQEREAREPVARPVTCLQCWARVSGLGGSRMPISLARLAELTCTGDSHLQTIHRFHKWFLGPLRRENIGRHTYSVVLKFFVERTDFTKCQQRSSLILL